MKKCYVVLGALFGDEGKGQVVQALVRQAKDNSDSVCVVRFSGGAQAAHNIRIKKSNGHVLHHTCSTYGSGVLYGVPTYLFSQTYFDPMAAWCERQSLMELTGEYPALLVHKDCRVVTPYDQYVGQKDTKVKNDGTCGKGIYPTFKRYNDGVTSTSMSVIKEYYKRYSFPDKIECLVNQVERDLNFGSWFMYFDNEKNVLDDYDVVIFEGSQGLLLDMDNGFWPNVTPSHTGLDNIKDYISNADVYLVMRPYVTRHGNGYEPACPEKAEAYTCELIEDNFKNEFQGAFKKGLFEVNLFTAAWDRHNLDNWKSKIDLLSYNMVFTHNDIFTKNETIQVFDANEILCDIKGVDDIYRMLPHRIREKIHSVYTLSGNTDTNLKYKEL